MTSSDWQSTGREPQVFQTERPKDLFGVHADLIAAELTPGERLRYLLYAPVWEGSEAPFGIRSHPASRAVAVTEHRFILSEDRHTEGIAPSVQAIPFEQILYVELGHALLLGWFAIRFIKEDVLCQTALLYNATGRHHFAAAVREYRALISGRVGNGFPMADQTLWTDVWSHTARYQEKELKSLVIARERPVTLLHSGELWVTERHWRKNKLVCLTTAGICVATDCGLLSVIDEPAQQPDMSSFGVNVSCIALDAVQSAALLERTSHTITLRFLRLTLGRNSAITHFDVPFAEESRMAAECLVHYLAQADTVGTDACTSSGDSTR